MQKSFSKSTKLAGFTLIEMAVVLTIIGLIVGGVLVGRSLIISSGVRASVSQIERYQSAVHAFDEKYGALPGDLNSKLATQFGFTPRGSDPGEGDGNGIMQGVYGTNGTNYGYTETIGENAMFWVDLTTANGLNLNLIDGSFSTASPTTQPPGGESGLIPSTIYSLYLPQAKIGGGAYIYVWSQNNTNYFAITDIRELFNYGSLYALKSLTVQQAYAIDSKMDDGMPQSGSVTAQGIGDVTPGWDGVAPGESDDGRSGLTCYDDYPNWVPPAANTYSLQYNNGNGLNCILSFQFQNQ
jgi:prepilin-type N-terminal cleavage/methylation domain-containing protein